MEATLKSSRKIILFIFCIGIILLFIKFFAFFYTQSNAILVDALESIINIITGGFALYSIYLIRIPKDMNHPYGHGKIEFFVFFVESILILLVGLALIGKSTYNFFYPNPIHNLGIGSYMIALTAVANFSMGYVLMKKYKKYEIITLQAEGKHLLIDGFVSLGIVVGLVLIILSGYVILDSIISVIVGLVVLWQGYIMLLRSIRGLMDEVDIKILKSIVRAFGEQKNPAWIDVHNLRIVSHGSIFHVDCHVTLPYFYNLVDVHDEVKKIEKLIQKKFTHEVELFIHADPCVPFCCRFCKLENCPQRSEPFSHQIDWTMERLLTNAKYYIHGKDLE